MPRRKRHVQAAIERLKPWTRPSTRPAKKQKTQHHTSTQSPQKPAKPHHQPSQTADPRPWPHDADVLLVGEGDFSFARSLYVNHRGSFGSLTATCYDSRDELVEKYPQSATYIRELEQPAPTTSHTSEIESDDDEKKLSDEAVDADSDIEQTEKREGERSDKQRQPATVLYGIDARKLASYKSLKKRKFDAVVFNFPHVGGLSTDVNRQVRHNQALLVDFFNAVKPLLRSQPNPASDGKGAGKGKVLVTLFEREPYTLWNVRDLARHCRYVVERSWRFDWGAWRGYEHARTVGNIKNKRPETGSKQNGDAKEGERDDENDDEGNEGECGEEEEFGGFSEDEKEDSSGKGGDERESKDGKRPGRWRGEEREARTYMFSLRDSDAAPSNKKKRRKGGSDSE